MKDAELAERRKAPRHAAAVPVGFDGGEGTTLDMSSGGVRFATAARPAPGDRLELMLGFQADGVVLRARARAVRVHSDMSDQGHVEVAAAFAEISFAGTPRARAAAQ